MSLQRSVEPEWLDQLAAKDPRAIRHRRDLKLINALMLQPSIMAEALAELHKVGAAGLASRPAGAVCRRDIPSRVTLRSGNVARREFTARWAEKLGSKADEFRSHAHDR